MFQGCGRAQTPPEILGNVGLQMRGLSGCGFGVQPQIECSLVRSFAAIDQPARKCVWLGRPSLKDELVRAESQVREFFRYRRRGGKPATPGRYFDEMIADSKSFNDILTAGEARSGNRARPLEELVFRALGNDASMVEHQKVGAETEGFFHVVRDEDNRAMKMSQSFAKLFLGLPAQMGIERGKRLVEEKRIRAAWPCSGQ